MLKFLYTQEISLCSGNFQCSEIAAFAVLCTNDSVFCFSHFYPHCNSFSLVNLVFHMFVRLYKPL